MAIDKTIDLKTGIDVTSRMSRVQARKVIARVFHEVPNFLSFSKHGLHQMKERNIRTGDILNILKAGDIYQDPELENGTYRYRVETHKMIVVIAFRKPNHITVITAWRKS